MKILRAITPLCVFITVASFSCENKPAAEPKNCDCDGTVKSTVADEQGTLEVFSGATKKQYRIVNQSRALFFAICDSNSINSLLAKGTTLVKFSGNVKEFCDQPNVNYIPPIYRLIILTKVEPLN